MEEATIVALHNKQEASLDDMDICDMALLAGIDDFCAKLNEAMENELLRVEGSDPTRRDRILYNEIRRYLNRENSERVALFTHMSAPQRIGVSLSENGAAWWNEKHRDEWIRFHDTLNQSPPTLPPGYIPAPVAMFTKQFYSANRENPGKSDDPNMVTRTLEHPATLGFNLQTVFSLCEKPKNINIVGGENLFSNGVDPYEFGVRFDTTSGMCKYTKEYCDRMGVDFKKKFKSRGEEITECELSKVQEVVETTFGTTMTRNAKRKWDEFQHKWKTGTADEKALAVTLYVLDPLGIGDMAIEYTKKVWDERRESFESGDPGQIAFATFESITDPTGLNGKLLETVLNIPEVKDGLDKAGQWTSNNVTTPARESVCNAAYSTCEFGCNAGIDTCSTVCGAALDAQVGLCNVAFDSCSATCETVENSANGVCEAAHSACTGIENAASESCNAISSACNATCDASFDVCNEPFQALLSSAKFIGCETAKSAADAICEGTLNASNASCEATRIARIAGCETTTVCKAGCTVLSTCNAACDPGHSLCETGCHFMIFDEVARNNCYSNCSSEYNKCKSDCNTEVTSCHNTCNTAYDNCKRPFDTAYNACLTTVSNTYDGCMKTAADAEAGCKKPIEDESPKGETECRAAQTSCKEGFGESCATAFSNCTLDCDGVKNDCISTSSSISRGCKEDCSQIQTGCNEAARTIQEQCIDPCENERAACTETCDSMRNSCFYD
jgi:hypothetical protein